MSRRVAALTVLLVTLSACAALTAAVRAEGARAAPGDRSWTRSATPSGAYETEWTTMARGPGGDFWLAATTYRGTKGDFVVVRYSAVGTRRWMKVIDTGLDEDQSLTDLAVDGSGNVYLAGTIRKTGGTLWFVAKVGPTGKVIWRRRLMGSGGLMSEWTQDVAVDRTGGVYVVGDLYRSAARHYDAAIVKYSPSGTIAWKRFIDGGRHDNDTVECATSDRLGRLYVGLKVVASSGDWDIMTARYRANGTRDWKQTWDGPDAGDDRPLGIAVSKAGVAVAGVSNAYTFEKGATLVYSVRGLPKWQAVEAGTGRITWRCVSIDGAGRVVSGGSTVFDPPMAMTTFSYKTYSSAGVGGFGFNGTGGDMYAHCYGVAMAGGVVYATGFMDNSDGDAMAVAGDDGAGYSWHVQYRDAGLHDDYGFAVYPVSGKVYVAGSAGAAMTFSAYVR
jgi:hypothetical protein